MNRGSHNDPDRGAAGADIDSTFQLLERVKAGETGAADELFARYIPALQRWAHGRLPGWARDVADTSDFVQDTVLEAFKRLERFEYRGEGALRAYLRQVLLNRIRREFRRAALKPAPTPLDSQAEDLGTSPLEAAIGREATERYEAGLARLKPADREAIISRIELGLTYAELAAALGKPSPNAARMAVARAMLRLAEEIEGIHA